MPDEPHYESEPTEEELERRLKLLLGEDKDGPIARPELAPEPAEEADDIEERIKQVTDKLDKARSQRMPDVPDWNYQRPKSRLAPENDPSNYKGLGVGISAGYTLVGCMLLGWFVGWIIDRPSHGTTYQAILALVGCIAGIGMVFWLINRSGSK